MFEHFKNITSCCLLSDGLVREDRYVDTGCLEDYYLLFSCRDRAGAKRGRCFNYFVTILIRHDPPLTNFPWDRAVRDMQRFGVKPRDFIFEYAGDGKAEILRLFYTLFFRFR